VGKIRSQRRFAVGLRHGDLLEAWVGLIGDSWGIVGDFVVRFVGDLVQALLVNLSAALMELRWWVEFVSGRVGEYRWVDLLKYGFRQ
jgi:hypothetical protein